MRERLARAKLCPAMAMRSRRRLDGRAPETPSPELGTDGARCGGVIGWGFASAAERAARHHDTLASMGARPRPGLHALAAVAVGAASLALAPGCASTRSEVLRGREVLPAAVAAMRGGGVVFAPYVERPSFGIEATYEPDRCIAAVNRAAVRALAARYPTQIGSRQPNPRTGMPHWARGLGGPRAAVHVAAFRCGFVVGEHAYTLASDGRSISEVATRGEVVLAVHDRTSGDAVVLVRAEAVGDDGVSAVMAAVERAVESISLED